MSWIGEEYVEYKARAEKAEAQVEEWKGAAQRSQALLKSQGDASIKEVSRLGTELGKAQHRIEELERINRNPLEEVEKLEDRIKALEIITDNSKVNLNLLKRIEELESFLKELDHDQDCLWIRKLSQLIEGDNAYEMFKKWKG